MQRFLFWARRATIAGAVAVAVGSGAASIALSTDGEQQLEYQEGEEKKSQLRWVSHLLSSLRPNPVYAASSTGEGNSKGGDQNVEGQQQDQKAGDSSALISAVDREGSVVHLNDGRSLKLVQVQVYFRHGARTPIHALPGNAEEERWDERLCQSLPDVERPLMVKGPDNSPRPLCAANLRQVSTKLPGGCHIGCLTVIGRNQAFSLGQRLREQYMDTIGFLSVSPPPLFFFFFFFFFLHA